MIGLRDFALIIGIMMIWGLNYPVAKIGVTVCPPMMLIGIRFALVAALMLPFVPMPRSEMRRIFYLSVVIALFHFGPNFTGLKYVDSGMAAILNQLAVPFSAILAAIFFQDRIGWRRMLGLALAFAGVAVLVGEPKRATDLWGASLTIFAALAWAISTVQSKFLKSVHPLALVSWMSLMAAPQIIVLSLILEDQPVAAALAMGWKGWGPIVYMATLVSIVSHSLWYSLIHRHPINVMAPFSLLTPVFGIMFGILILDEPLTWWMIAGSLITLAGVTIITIRRPAQAEPPPER